MTESEVVAWVVADARRAEADQAAADRAALAVQLVRLEPKGLVA